MKTCKSLQVLAFILGGALFAQAQVATEAWVRRYTTLLDSADQGAAVATDQAGDVIVAGSSNAGIQSSQDGDWLVIKYSEAGIPLWTNRYDGPDHRADVAKAVAVGSNGTIYVTGTSAGLVGGFSGSGGCVIVAYTPAGEPLWTNRFEGVANLTPVAIGVSSSGVVAVTGNAYSLSGYPNTYAPDYVTIATTETGVPLWTNRYTGPALSSLDRVYGLAVSPNGMVIVTGESEGVGSSMDFVTITYSSAGVPLWTNRYNGPANGADQAPGLAVGKDGTVLVTGYSSNGGTNGYDFDYATIAYTAAGVPLWINRYKGPNNYPDGAPLMAVSLDGNAYVAGYTSNSIDYSTFAYSSAGVLLWTNRYDGPGNGTDKPVAIAAGTNGAVFVTGISYGGSSSNYATIAYSATGVPLWTNRYDGPGNGSDRAAGVAVNPSGNVFVTGTSAGSSSLDCATTAYSGTGLPLWTNIFNGLVDQADQAKSVVVGPDGTVFVSGKSLGLTKFTTIAFSSAGVPLWTNDFNGLVNTWDASPTLAVSSDGTLFVAGMLSTAGLATVAYSNAGIPLWTNFNSGVSYAAAAALSPSGTLYISAYYINKGGTFYRTIAVSSSGTTLWNNGGGNSLGVDGSGNVFTTAYGYTYGYSESGTPLWTNRYNGSVTLALAVSPNGNVIVTGSSTNDFATIAYSNGGVPLWTNRYNGPGNLNDYAVAVSVGANGTGYVTGVSPTSAGVNAYATIAYSEVGVPLWTNIYVGSGISNMASAVGVSSNGKVFVTGFSTGGSSSNDFATVVYSESGIPLSTNLYNGPGNGSDTVSKYSLALASDAVVIAGTSDISPRAGSASDYAVVKYLIAPPVPSPDSRGLLPASIALLSGGEAAQLTFYGVSGAAYVLEHTFELGSNTWTPVQTNTAGVEGAILFTAPPVGPVGFWRIRPLQ